MPWPPPMAMPPGALSGTSTPLASTSDTPLAQASPFEEQEDSPAYSTQVAAMCGSLCLEGKAIKLLCELARQRPQQYPPATPSAAARPSPPGHAGAGAVTPSAASQSTTSGGTPFSPSPMFTYTYLKSARNHMSTRAAMCLCQVVALAHSDGELDEQLHAGVVVFCAYLWVGVYLVCVCFGRRARDRENWFPNLFLFVYSCVCVCVCVCRRRFGNGTTTLAAQGVGGGA
jgi:hypothetical protein